MGRRLQTYTTDHIAVTYDPVRCIHAAECVRSLPLVFDPSRRRWIQLEHAPADEIAAVVRRCPTGALQYQLASGDPEAADATPRVQVRRRGPLYVRGDVQLTTEDGVVIATGTRLALCRCGASRNKPFCDGSHHEIGFDM